MSEGWQYFLDFKGQTFEIQEGEQTVGRSRTCDVSINDPSVSRRHVVVKADSGRILLKDLGSSNGTFINGDRIEESGELHHDDTLGLGDADLTVRVVGTSAFETVRMSAHPLEKPHGDATLFLQEASARLAQDAIDLGQQEPSEASRPEAKPAAPSHMAPAPIEPSKEPPTAAPQAVPIPEAPTTPAASQPEAPPAAPPTPPSHMAPLPVQPVQEAPQPPAPAAPAASPTADPTPAASTPAASPSPAEPAPVITEPSAPRPVALQPVAPQPETSQPVLPPPEPEPAELPMSPVTTGAPSPDVPRPAKASPAVPPPGAGPREPVPPASPPPATPPPPEPRFDQSSGDLLPSLDGFDSTMGPEMLAALRAEAAEKPTEPMPSPPNPYGAPVQQQPPAGFGIRLLAAIVDGLWMSALYLAAFFFGDPLAGFVAAAIGLIVVLFGWAIWGTTPGKRAFNLYVATGTGAQAGIGFPRAVARLVGYLVSTITLGIGFLMIAFSDSKRGLHDLIAGTQVRRQA